MKTTKTDILRICKGHYNQEKYNSPYEALRAYQIKYTGCEPEHINEQAVLSFFYAIEVDSFLQSYHYKEMIKDRLIHDYEMSLYNYANFEISYKYMVELYIRQLSMIQVKEGENWIIDLSDYKQGDLVI